MAAQNQFNKVLLTRVYVHHKLWPEGGEEVEEEEGKMSYTGAARVSPCY